MKKRTNILVECPELIASVRVGVLEPLSELQNSQRCNVLFKRTIQISKKDIQWCDILITVRGYEYVTMEIVKAAKRAGRYVIYFLDDDLLNIPQHIPSGSYFQNQEIKGRLIEIISLSDRLWCVNTLIAEKYSKYCGGKFFIGKVPITNKPLNSKTVNYDIVRILYAGSADHTQSVIKYITPAVSKLCREYKSKIEFTFIGVNPGLSNNSNVRYIDYINDYNEYKRIVEDGNYDIGLAVIQEDEFYKAKYYNKFMEYTSIGAVGVYTDSPPYTLVVEDNKNGFLCSENSWYDILKKVIDDPESRRQCYNNARKIIEERFNYTLIGQELVEKNPELISFRSDKTKKVVLLNTRNSYYKHRIIEIWNEHKFLFLFYIIVKICRFIIRKIRIIICGIRRKKCL